MKKNYKVNKDAKDAYGRRIYRVEKNEDDNELEEGMLAIGPATTVNLKRRTEDLNLDSVVGKK